MSITSTGQGNSGIRTNAQSTCSFSFNNVAGDFFVLVITARDTSPHQAVSTSTKPRWGTTGGDANDGRFTFRARTTSSTTDIGWVEFWHLKNAPTGTNNMDVTLDGNVDFAWQATLLAFNGVDPTIPWNVPEQSKVVINQPTALSLNDIGVLQDEEDAYGILNWTYTGGQLPTIPDGPYTAGSTDVHNELEADDVWQNLVMYNRTGVQGYADLRDAWKNYYLGGYLTNFASDLSSFFGDHTFGWGLVDYGGPTRLAAANAIGDAVESDWYNVFSPSTKNCFNGMRGPGRILKLACALGRMTWARDIWIALRDSAQWHEPVLGGVQVGYWHELDATTVAGDPPGSGGPFPWAAGSTGMISSFSVAVLNNGLADYFDLTGDQEVERRLKLMARFSEKFMMDTSGNPPVNHTGHWIMVDAFGVVGTFYHSGLGSGLLLDPFYTCTQVNTLVRGYILTGDIALLNRAVFHWDRSSRAIYNDTYPYTNRPAEVAGEVGYFMNSRMLSPTFYISDGELTYVGTLFKAITNLNPTLSKPAAPDTLTAVTFSSTAIDLHWFDRSNNETGFRIEQAIGAGAFSEIAIVPANTNTFRDNGLTASTLYRYQVRAYNGQGNSLYTNVAQDTTSAGSSGTVPTAPGSLTVTAITYSQINLTWADLSSDESGFRIKRCSGAACTPTTVIATVGAGVTAFTDFTVGANTLYRYTVEAFNNAGPSSPTSTEEATTPATTDAWTVMANSSLRDLLLTSPGPADWITPGNTPDGKSNPMENILISWSGGIIFERPNNEIWLIIKNGGHDSWFWNDVWGYEITDPTSGWQMLRKSFLPYITYQDWDNNVVPRMNPYDGTFGTSLSHTIFTDGSPGNAHTYDGVFYSPDTDEVMWYEGAHTAGSGRQAPINHFNMSTHLWSYGPYWSDYFPSSKFPVTHLMPSGNIAISANQGMYEYNPSTKLIINRGTSISEYTPYSTGRYVNGKMYVFCPDVPIYSGMIVKVQEVGVGESILPTSGPAINPYSGPGVAWEPDISKFVIWGGNRQVFLLDPATGEKTERNPGGADPGEPIRVQQPGNFHLGTYKRFERVGSGQYILMNSLDEIHKLTLDLGGGPPASLINFNGSTDLWGTEVSPLVGSHTCSGTNRLGVVLLIGDTVGTGFDDITSVTWGGVAMTLRKKAISGFPDSAGRNLYFYDIYLSANGLNGAQDIVITSANDHALSAIAASYTGVMQSGQPDVAAVENHSPLATSSSLMSQLTTVTDKCWTLLLESSFVSGVTPTAGAGAVHRRTAGFIKVSLFDSGSEITPAGLHSMTTTLSTSPTVRGINHIMVAYKPA